MLTSAGWPTRGPPPPEGCETKIPRRTSAGVSPETDAARRTAASEVTISRTLETLVPIVVTRAPLGASGSPIETSACAR